jgi:hypothetical protein
MRPLLNEFAPNYAPYIEKVLLSNSIENTLKLKGKEVENFFLNLPKEKHDFAYEVGKWTPKDILLHNIDVERIYTYRALRISRCDQSPNPGFDENEYALHANAENRTMESLVKEFKTVRKATISFFKNLTETQLSLLGIASGNDVSVRAIGFILIGHEQHHVEIIKERYL